MKQFLTLILIFSCLVPLFAEDRPGNVDFVILFDTSLSMENAIDDAKQYIAGDIAGRYIIPGDWVTIISFFGETKAIWEGTINNDKDIATVVRSLHNLKADGRFTDIGNALDTMDQILRSRNRPDRQKYILLVTDEKQEAREGTKYYSSDYSIKHPFLDYIKREDKGSFRVITIGYGLTDKIGSELSSLSNIITDPPNRPEELLPGTSKEDSSNINITTETVNAETVNTETVSAGTEPTQTAVDTNSSNLVQDNKIQSTSEKQENNSKEISSPKNASNKIIPIVIIVFVVIAIIVFVLLLISSKKKNTKPNKKKVIEEQNK